MNDQDIVDLARDYGLDISDYDEDYIDASVDAAVPRYATYHDDIEDFSEEHSSPSPRVPVSYQRVNATAGNIARFNHVANGAGESRGNMQQLERDMYPHGRTQRSSQHAPQYAIQDFGYSPQHALPNTREVVREDRRGTSQGHYEHFDTKLPAQSQRIPASGSGGREDRGLNPRNAHGIKLRPTSELPLGPFTADIYRSLFKFGVFNAVQSKCFDTVMESDHNMVVSAPTGSGKTVLFELAILRMHIQSASAGPSKCIYVAPTKALCSEKYREWSVKFNPLGIKCCELTGDTVQFGRSVWGDARDASVIVTTGEKWDSLTRNWDEHESILSQISLFLVDEVHILNEARGSTLEVIISRMKARGSSVRFILVSATVPNIRDVAAWIGQGSSRGLGTVLEFGEEYRPCKLTKFVYGIPRKKDQNDFVFSRVLDFRLYAILKQHSVNKPALVFCSTRKGVVVTAEQLMKEYEEAAVQKQTLPWSRPTRIERNFHDKRLAKLATSGIGVHHAGMSLDDRRATEELYLSKILRVVVATSTLAVGVNLPAHTVVIKGVKIFQNNASQEYSDLDIVQMLGRAGRPQFDKEGIAIILCEKELENKYQTLVQGRTVLESCLHRNLAEHINSEIGLGTITNIESAKQWIHNSFLFQRIQQNPLHYSIGKEGTQTWQARIDAMVTESIKQLQLNQLVATMEEDDTALCSTEYGEIMSKYYIRQSTMSCVLNIPRRVTLKDLIEVLASADEFSDIKIRSGEKQIYGKLRTHDDIRFKLKKVEKAGDKISLIIQAILGGISLNDSEYKNGDNQPSLEALSIFRHVSRIARVIVEVGIAKKSGCQVKYGMELMRCLSAKAWEDRPVVLRQIEHIGEKSIKARRSSRVLAQHGITSFDTLGSQDPIRIEALLSRRPPFGHQVLAFVHQLPKYWLKIEEAEVTVSNGKKPVEVELSIECGVREDNADLVKAKRPKSRFRDTTLVLTTTSDLEFIDFRRISTKALKSPKSFTITARLTKPSQSVIVQMASEVTAGITVERSYKPNLSHGDYPVMDTRPMTSLEMDMDGIADDPEFWEYVPSEDEPERSAIDLIEDISPSPRTTESSASIRRQENSAKRDLTSQKSQNKSLPQRLPNGNYACGHMCKDKSACKHLCCREGTEKAPQWTKRRVETIYPTEEPSKKPIVQIPEPTLKPKPVARPKTEGKPDSRLKNLETLHQKTNVNASIRLPEGRRLKISEPLCASGENKLRQSKPAPEFDLAFTDLKQGEPNAPMFDPASLDSSDDELPDTRGVLAAYKQTQKGDSSETGHTDPEFDDLIRQVPWDSTLDDSYDSGTLVHKPLEASPPALSRVKEVPQKRLHETSPGYPSKRSQRSDRSKNPTSPEARKPAAGPSHTEYAQYKHRATPLFLDRSSDYSQKTPETPRQNEQEYRPLNDDFVLDEHLFDIVSSESNASQAELIGSSGQSGKAVSRDDPRTTSSKVDTGLSNNDSQTVYDVGPVEQEAQSTTMDDKPDGRDILDQQLNEFFEWLHSGSVILVDKMDMD